MKSGRRSWFLNGSVTTLAISVVILIVSGGVQGAPAGADEPAAKVKLQNAAGQPVGVIKGD